MRHRRLIVARGTPEQTRREACRLIGELPEGDVLWVEEEGPERSLRPSKVRHLLGRAFDAVVLDLHGGIDADLLGQAHGLVWGGGALILRMPPAQTLPPRDSSLAIFPYPPEAVSRRFWRHLERALDRAEVHTPDEPLRPVSHEVAGTEEQARVADALAAHFTAFGDDDDDGAVAVLVADRGRGKSSALGLALRQALERRPGLRVAVTAGHRDAVGEVLRFAGDSVPFVPAADLIGDEHDTQTFDVIVVDEAAGLPVPLLERLVRAHPHARIAFATTTHGYEGTGRGFLLRFLSWLDAQDRHVTRFGLDAPIRWDAGDPVERFVFDALLLDAEPASAITDAAAPVLAERLDRDALVDDEGALREFFGLLVHAHYRTTPGDLHRLLDAPNVHLHAMRQGRRIVAATLVAEEGALPPDTCARLDRGEGSIRGHALAESLAAHMGHPEAGALRMLRSVRIAVHPDLRRRGLGTRLIEHVHQAHRPDLFGTLFGATPELLDFRRGAGYELVRLSASRGSRTGEPSAMMIRAVSDEARDLLDTLRAELARDLPLQLELMQSDGDLLLDPGLEQALLTGLPAPAELSEEALRRGVADYAYGPRTFESVALPVLRYVERHADRLDALPPADQALIEARVLARRSWPEVTRAAGQSSIRAAMRGLRRAFRALVEAVEGGSDEGA